MQTTAQRFNVPAGFSGWWCTRCAVGLDTVPEDVDAAQTRCPKCHKWTAWWIPPMQNEELKIKNEETKRQPAGRALESAMAGKPWVRQRPRDERARELFAHIREVIEHPDVNPDLRKIEDEEYRR